MGVLGRLRDWMAAPDIAASRYECTDCDVLLSPESDVCPECGGEVAIVEPDLSRYYWDVME